MEGEKSYKVIAIVALCIGVVGLTLGFATLSSQLIIKSSVSVSPDKSTFNVDFSTTSDSVVSGAITGVASEGAKAGSASIDNSKDDSVVKDLHATFTAAGQSVTYSFYARNTGQYDAFLNTVTFANAMNGESDLGSFKICTAGTDTDKDLVEEACKGITLTVSVNGEEFTSSIANLTETHKLNSRTSEPIIVTIAYNGDVIADGDFSVAFGDVTLKYETVES